MPSPGPKYVKMKNNPIAESKVKAHLEPGERLLWASAPNVDHIEDLKMDIHTVWGLFILSTGCLAIVLAIADGQHSVWSGLGLVALMLGAAGFVWWRLSHRSKELRATHYGVTDRRAIKLVSGNKSKVTSLFSDDINTLGIVEQQSGYADLHLKHVGGEHSYYIGFKAIQDAERVRSLIERHVLTDNKRFEVNYFKNLKEDVRGLLKKWF